MWGCSSVELEALESRKRVSGIARSAHSLLARSIPRRLSLSAFLNYGSLPKLTQDGSVDTKGIEKRIASGEMRGNTSCGEGAHLQMVNAT